MFCHLLLLLLVVLMSLEWEIPHPELYISWKILCMPREHKKMGILYAFLYKLLSGMQLQERRKKASVLTSLNRVNKCNCNFLCWMWKKLQIEMQCNFLLTVFKKIWYLFLALSGCLWMFVVACLIKVELQFAAAAADVGFFVLNFPFIQFKIVKSLFLLKLWKL